MRIAIALFLVLFFGLRSVAQCISGDCFEGYGELILPDGSLFRGAFERGAIGHTGVLVLPDGAVYQGAFESGMPNGFGTLTLPHGESRYGFWVNGLPIDEHNNIDWGWTVRSANTLPPGKTVQSGCISGNCQNGEGALVYPSGARYEGFFQENKPHGRGKWLYEDKSEYIGQFKNGKRHGVGTLLFTDGSMLSGKWVDDEYVGAENWSETAVDVCVQGNCTNGYGVYVFENARYVGYFVNGQMHGSGTITYRDGSRYTGRWANGKADGYGTLFVPRQPPLEGYWQAGQWSGKEPGKVKPANVQPAANSDNIEKAKRIKTWAVVVGISDYIQMQPLRYTDSDSYKFYAHLRSPEGGSVPDKQIKLLINETATRAAILEALEEVKTKAGSNDRVILYFSGHGMPGFFIPYDFDGYTNKLKHDDIVAALKNCKAKYKLVLMDACNAGSLFTSKGITETMDLYYGALSKAKEGTAFLLSSRAEENSLESNVIKQGVFSHFVLRGLEGEADADADRIVTFAELADFVVKHVHEYTQSRQMPVVRGHFDPQMPMSVVRDDD